MADPAWEDGFEALEEKILLAAQPVVAVSADPHPLIGSSSSIEVTFSNAAPGGGPADVGFAPYVDLVLPHNGADGAGVGDTPQNDGVSFTSASYLGQPLDATVLEFDAAGQAVHPFARDATGQLIVVDAADFGAAPGDQLVVLRLPYGSFSPGQTPADITVNFDVSNLADVNTPLPVAARGGFAFGTDPLNNPMVDPTVLGPTGGSSVTPELLTLDKIYNFREQETVSGPSFPHAWTVDVDVAPGQTLTNLVLTDRLPDGIVVLGASITSGQAGVVTVDPATNLVTATFADPVVGGPGADAQLRIDFHVGEFLAPGQPAVPVLDPVTGAPRALPNDAAASGTWIPIDPRDPPQTVTVDPPGPEDVITAKAFEVEKSTALAIDRAAPGLGPLDTLQYTLDFQVSDYFSIGAARFTDVLSDGVAFDAGFAPTLTISLGPHAGSHSFDASSFTHTRDAATGQTTLTFDVAALLGGGGVLSGPVVGQLVYRATVEGTYLATGGAVHAGDTLSNAVLVDGDIIGSSGSPTGGHVQDDSSSAVTIHTGSFDKSVYAKNGVLVAPGSDVVVASGDLVTYRLRLALPQTLAASLLFNDFLPLPVFSVQGVTFTFDDTVSAAVPGENVVKWGPDAGIFDAIHAADPVLATLPNANALTIRFGDIVAAPPVASVVDLLFSVRAQDRPFGDGLLLANLATSYQFNSHNHATVISDIARITLAEPELHIGKGVVGVETGQAEFPTTFTAPVGPVAFAPPGSTGAPFTGIIDSAALAAQPVDADLSGVDGGDLVRFAITVENVGGGPKGAHDILIRDTLPAGLVIPPGGLNLTVYRGDGTVIPYVLEGAGLFDPNGGIRLLDPSDTDPGNLAGALDPAGTGSGNNIAVIVYDLRVIDTAAIAEFTATNVARIEFYAAQENGAQFADNLLPDQREDDAGVTTGAPRVDKVLVSTSLPESTGSAVLIGEQATFTVTATFREGFTHDVILSDILPTVPGVLGFVSARVIAVGGNLGYTGAQLVPGQVLPHAGGGVQISLGDVTNLADNAVTDADRIVIEITGLVTNVPQNNNGDVLVNTGRLTWTDPDATVRHADGTASVHVIEPVPNIDKVANVTTADAGDIVTYTLTITNPASAGAAAPGFDVSIGDLLADPDLLLIPGTVTLGGSLAATASVVLGNGAGDATILVTMPRIDPDQTLTVTYQVQISDTVETARVLRNTATMTSDSAPGDVPGQRVYTDRDDAVVNVARPAISKAVIATSLPDTGAGQGNPGRQDVAFGEEVTYRVTLRFAEGTTPDAAFLDRSLLNGGMRAISATVVSVGANLSFTGAPGPVIADTTGDGVADTVSWNLGTLINATDGLSDANDTIVLDIVFRLRDQPGLNAGSTVVNTASLGWHSPLTSGSVSAQAAFEVVAPALTITKAPDRLVVDAGDTITYTVRLVNGAGAFQAPAYDLIVDDLLADPAIDLASGSVAVSGVGGAIVQTGNNPGDGTIRILLPKLSPGQAATITYQAVVNASALSGSQIVNLARSEAGTYPGDDYGVPRDGERIYHRDAQAVVKVGVSTETKTVASTSLPETGSAMFRPGVPDVAIGEEATYAIRIRLAEGTSVLSLRDALPAGAGWMEYLSYAIQPLPADTNLDFIPGTEVATASDRNGDGIPDTLDIVFGTIVNTPDNIADGRDEIVVLLTARVIDRLPGNVAGRGLTNAATVFLSGVPEPVVTAELDIVEPGLLVGKLADRARGDAGDVVTYKVTVTPTAGMTGPAFGASLSDLLDPKLALVAGSVTTSLGTVVTGNNAGDSTIGILLPTLLPGAPAVTITYQARLTDAVQSHETLPNTVTLDYRSAPDAGLARDYSDAATNSLRVALDSGLAKKVIATSVPLPNNSGGDPNVPDAVVGALVTYTITARLGEGTQDVVIDELPPAGGTLLIEEASVAAIGANISGALLQVGDSGTAIAGGLRFDFGRVVNAGDNVADSGDEIVILVRARVANVPATVPVVQLVNHAALAVGSDFAPVPDLTVADAAVDIVGPVLHITKQAAQPGGDAGDAITYSVSLFNDPAATGPAFDVVLTDLVPAGMSLVAGSVTASRGTIVSGNGAGDSVVRVELGADAIQAVDLAATPWDDTRLDVTYRLVFDDTVEHGQAITNTAAYTANSAPAVGANGQARPFAGSANATVTVDIPVAIAKAILATSLPETGAGQHDPSLADVAIGETITYRVTATVGEGTQRLVIADTLDAGLAYESGSIVAVGAGLPAGLQGVVPTVSGQVLTFDLGTVVNAGDNDPTNDVIVIDIIARVRDVPGNVSGAVLTNGATITATPPTTGGPVQTGAAAVFAEIVVPDLVLDKTAPPGFAHDGEILTYTVTISHAATSTAAAFDVLVADLVGDPHLALVPGTVTTTLGAVETGNGAGDARIAVRIPVLALGQSVTVTYQAQVAHAAPPVDLANTATGDFSTAPPGEGGRPGHATDTAIVRPAPDFTKAVAGTSLPETGSGAFDPSVPDLAIGETVTYRLTAVLPQGLTQNVTLSDLLPAGLVPLAARVVAAGSGLTVGAPTIAISGQAVTLSFGDILNGSGAVVDAVDALVVEVDAVLTDLAALTAGTMLTNAAALGFTIDGRDGVLNGAAPVEVVEPGFTLAKTADQATGDAGDSFLYTITLAPRPDATGPAYQVRITDAPPAPMVLDPASVSASAGTVSVVNGRIVVALDVLLPGDAPVVITYRASFADAIEHGQVVTNTAAVAWVSAPAAPARPGGESATASVQGDLPVALDKRIVATSLPETGSTFFDPARPDIAAGETITYRLVATVAEGTQRLVLTDALPPGLAADAVRVVAMGANIAAGAPVVVIAGQSVHVDFGTVVNAADNAVTASDTIVVEIDARLLPGVAAGTVLMNDAALTATAPSDPSVPARVANASAAADAVQAALVIDKQVDATVAALGETVTYTITVSHAGNSSAPVYGLVIADPLPEPAMRLVAGSVTASTGQVVSGNAAADGAVGVLVPVLLPGQSVTITFRVQFAGVPIPGGVAANTASFTATSAPGQPGSPMVTTLTGSDEALLPVSGAAPVLRGGLLGEFDEAFRRIGRNAIIVPPALAGTAAPGSVVTLAIVDSTAAPTTTIGRTTDMGGHWMATVPVVAGDLPLPDEVAFVAVAQAAGRPAAAAAGAIADAGAGVGGGIFAPAAVQPAALDLPRTVVASVTGPAFAGFNSPADGLQLSFGGTVASAGFFAPRGNGTWAGETADGSALARSVAALAAPNSLALNSFAQSFIASLNAASSTSR